VRADPFRLKQVLVNLLSNAVKYNRIHGSVQVKVSASGPFVCIAIEDTGLGIPRIKMDQLFQPFNRLGAEQTEVEGTGIGLSICKRMVEAMHGRIHAESEEGKGSCFSIELPALDAVGVPDEASPHQSQGATRVKQEVPVSRPHILVAEDHIVNQKLIRRQLELLGYTCSVVGHGAEAMEALRAQDYALLLSDINMPVMDGYTLATQLRANGYPPERLPIVFLTADVFNAGNDKWKTCGGNAYLTKPTQVDALAECLRQILAPR
jgi:CheY-like chemotaxis protein/anti-sigma regulatory factor (Ser/Thr protein kinase)